MDLLGFTLTRKKKDKKENVQSLVQSPTDGSLNIPIHSGDVSGAYHYWMNWEGNIAEEKELIEEYRKTSLISEVSHGISEIVDEAIVVDDNSPIVEIQLDDTEYSKNVKDKISEEFKYILGLLNFNNVGDQIFRQWYIDGRHYYHKVVDQNKPNEGIKELNWLDPIRTKKIREIHTKDHKTNEGTIQIVDFIEEYYVHDLTQYDQYKSSQYQIIQTDQKFVRLSPDAITYSTSGIYDQTNGRVLSYLHKAIKPAHQLA
jgi:hypothetical protein